MPSMYAVVLTHLDSNYQCLGFLLVFILRWKLLRIIIDRGNMIKANHLLNTQLCSTHGINVLSIYWPHKTSLRWILLLQFY